MSSIRVPTHHLISDIWVVTRLEVVGTHPRIGFNRPVASRLTVQIIWGLASNQIKRIIYLRMRIRCAQIFFLLFLGPAFAKLVHSCFRWNRPMQLMESPDCNRQETIIQGSRLPPLQTIGYSSFNPSEIHPDLKTTQAQHQPPMSSIHIDRSIYAPFQTTSTLLASEVPQPTRSLLDPSFITRPSINVVPPTPINQQSFLNYSQPDSPSAMNPSMGSSMDISSKSTTPRKQPRFTMGPRADCEKCRLGVKGHFVHLD